MLSEKLKKNSFEHDIGKSKKRAKVLKDKRMWTEDLEEKAPVADEQYRIRNSTT